MLFIQVIGLVAPVTTNARAAGTSALRVGFLANIESLNPYRGINDADYFFYGLVYDYLFALDENGNPQPDIALTATQDPAGYNWTYEIRPGVLWHDLTPLTVRDVAFSLNYQVQKRSGYYTLWAYEPYVNRVVICPTDYVEGGPNCGANVTGPNEVTIHFDMPFVAGQSMYFPIIQWKQWCNADSIAHCRVTPFEAQGGGAGGGEKNLNPIGTGPFMADPQIGSQWTAGQPLLLHRNPNYHLYVPQIDDIWLVSGMSDVTLTQSLQSGEIDVAEVTPGGYEALKNVQGVGEQEYLMSTQYWIELGFEQINVGSANSKLNPARWDQNVRRALSMATNKDAIIRSDFLGKGARGSSLMSPITPFWHYDPANASIEPDPSVNLTYNVAAANALLDAAGYDTVGSDGIRMASRDIPVDANGVPGTVPAGTRLSFKLGVRQEYPQEQAAARDIVSFWRQVGVEITNVKGTAGTFEVMLESALEDAVYYSHTIDTYIWYWSGDPDPNYLLSIESNYTLDGWNDNYWDNTTYNGLYVQSLAGRDPMSAARQAIVLAAEKVHYESAVYLILTYPFGEWAYREDKFVGWGDWATHPYRQLNAFWTAPPLFRDLRPAPSSLPVPTVTLADSGGRPGQPVTITGTITDTVGGTWTLDFGDQSTDATGTYTAGTTTVTQDHTYANEGTYTARLTADNGQSSSITQVAQITVTATGNLKPDQVVLSGDLSAGVPGSRVNFTLSAHDEEGGTLTFNINYDDSSTGTKTVSNVAPDVVTTVTFSHVYPEAGSYIVTANVSDGQSVSSLARFTVTIQAPPAPRAAGIDPVVIGTGVAVAIVAIAVAVVWMRRRKKGEERVEPPGPPKP